jgi:two-component system sensor histidine kinase HydH
VRSSDANASPRISLVLGAEPSPGLAGRLAWMTGLRLAFFTILLALTGAFYLGGELSRYPVTLRIVFATITVAYALGGAYAVILRTGRHLEKLAYAQIILDQVTWSAIVYVTGGATSGATSFYAFSCLIGASLIGLRGSFTAAAAGGVSLVVLCGLFGSGWLAPPPDQSGAYLTRWSAPTHGCSRRSGWPCSDASPRGSPTRSEIRSDPFEGPSRCSASRLRCRPRTRSSAPSCGARRYA